MSVTLINKIFGQSLGTKWNPVTESQTQADSIEAAMRSMPTYVADAADRDSRFTTTPDPGSTCYRADMEWTEVYLPARTGGGSADPGRPAGWYPTSGHMPSFEVGQIVNSVPDGSETTLLGYATADRSAWGGAGYAGNGVWNLNRAGRWMMTATAQVPSATAGARQFNLRRNGVGTAGILDARMQVSLSGTVTLNIAAEVIAGTNNDSVSLSYQQSSGAAMNVTMVTWKAVYLGPN